jgi:hypothetical protein
MSKRETKSSTAGTSIIIAATPVVGGSGDGGNSRQRPSSPAVTAGDLVPLVALMVGAMPHDIEAALDHAVARGWDPAHASQWMFDTLELLGNPSLRRH